MQMVKDPIRMRLVVTSMSMERELVIRMDIPTVMSEIEVRT